MKGLVVRALGAVSVLSILVASPGGAQQLLFHGYGTQGIGRTTDVPQAGLTPDASLDMRALALQGRLFFRTTGTQVVAQAAHRRVGGSPTADLIDDVELDWAFAQQRVGPMSVRVGRVPMPKGLVNERRDVGTLLPFYQASKAFYTDGIESLDGGVLGYFGTFGAVDLQVDAFHGTIPVVVTVPGVDGPAAIDEDGEDTFGIQASIGLPLHGVRIVGGMLDADVPQESSGMRFTLDWETQWVGAEYQDDRVFARVEQYWSYVPTFQDGQARYAQAGVRPWRSLWINGQRETSSVEILDPAAFGFTYDPIGDWAVGLSYAVTSQLVLKGEHHWSDGYALDQLVDITGPAIPNRYFLFSIAAAF